MTALREAAQQALEALETRGEHHPRVYEAITGLRAALAEPNHDYERGFVEGISEQARRSVDKAVNAMAERKPLTDEEIRELWSWAMTAEAERTATTQQHAFARAIEKAHGIGSERPATLSKPCGSLGEDI